MEERPKPSECNICLPPEYMAEHGIAEGHFAIVEYRNGERLAGKFQPIKPSVSDAKIAARAQLIRDLAVAWVRSDRAITVSGPDAVGVAQRLANFADEVLGVMDGE